MKILLIFRFFHYIWFIGSENLCFIPILKEKMTRFWHLNIVHFPNFEISVSSNKRHTSVSKFNKCWGRLFEEIQYARKDLVFWHCKWVIVNCKKVKKYLEIFFGKVHFHHSTFIKFLHPEWAMIIWKISDIYITNNYVNILKLYMRIIATIFKQVESMETWWVKW